MLLALVTGASSGIGKEIVRELCKRKDVFVLLSSRDPIVGNQAVNELKTTIVPFHNNLAYLQLDVTNANSISESVCSVAKESQSLFNEARLDILINNAGVIGSTEVNYDLAKQVLETNFTGVINVTKAFAPLLANSKYKPARVIITSSQTGHISQITNKDLKDRFLNAKSVDDIQSVMNDYLKDVKFGKVKENGWGNSIYAMSKLGVNALTECLHRELSDQSKISVNAFCPGYCQTKMTQFRGRRTPAEGAKTAIFLAFDPAGEESGGYYVDCKPHSWTQKVKAVL